MRIRIVEAVVIGAVGFGLSPAAHAKARLERVDVSGGDLARTASLTDQKILDLANPWHGELAAWTAAPIAAPAPDLVVYEVTMHARARSGEMKAIYRVRYAPGTDGRAGAVYLPGKGESGHRQNVSTISRSGQDGHWLPATPEWDAHLSQILAR